MHIRILAADYNYCNKGMFVCTCIYNTFKYDILV